MALFSRRLTTSKCLLYVLFFLTILTLSYIVYVSEFAYDDIEPEHEETISFVEEAVDPLRVDPIYFERETDNKHPIIIWWTPFHGKSKYAKKCSKGTCLFTPSRTEFDNPLTGGFMYYGTSIKWNDLPLPRQPNHLWFLLHEESPKNNWVLAFEEGISLFNYTCTPSRHSSYPITTQYLPGLEYLTEPAWVETKDKGKGDLAVVNYVQSDCGTPSDRDMYVKELMKHMKVDSYGKCVHNKDLPEHLVNPIGGMDAKEFMMLQGRYKFTLVMENAICEDYITEKLWRPLHVGSVPVIFGSPSVQDWLPDKKSGIIVNDFSSPKELAEFLLSLDKDDEKYEEYLKWKKDGITNQYLLKHIKERPWGDDKMINYIDRFECAACDKVFEMKEAEENSQPFSLVADHSHYNCMSVVPMFGNEEDRHDALTMKKNFGDDISFWIQHEECAKKRSKLIHNLLVAKATKEKIANLTSSVEYSSCIFF